MVELTHKSSAAFSVISSTLVVISISSRAHAYNHRTTTIAFISLVMVFIAAFVLFHVTSKRQALKFSVKWGTWDDLLQYDHNVPRRRKPKKGIRACDARSTIVRVPIRYFLLPKLHGGVNQAHVKG